MTILDIPVFTDLSAWSLFLLGTLYFLSFVVKGMFGLGSMPPLVVFGAWIVGPHESMLLAAFANGLAHMQFVPEAIRNGSWSIVRGLIVAYVPSTALGVWLFSRLETAGLAVVLGAVLTAVVLAEGFSVFERWEEPIRRHPRRVGWLLAGVSGMLGGLTGAGGVVMVSLYIKMMCPEMRLFRATVLLVTTFVMIWRMISFGVAGFVSVSLLLECLILIPISLVGGYLGSRLFGRLPREHFFWGFRIVIVVAALNLVRKGARELIG